MNLIKKNIHMNREKSVANTQIPLEEDVNISDKNPDAGRIITQKGIVQIEDMQIGNDAVKISGHLNYSVLYLAEDESMKPCLMKGRIFFEETVHMEGLSKTEDVQVKAVVEDINVSLINSRKISVQALILLQLKAEELYDEELVVDVEATTPMEVQKKSLETTGLTVNMKDLYRIREEIPLPAEYPGIYHVLWSDYNLMDMEWKLMEGQLGVSGQLQLFILYESDEQEGDFRTFECVRPINGTLQIPDCREDMIGDITHEVEHVTIEPRADFDKEERIFSVDMALHVYIKILEQKTIQVVNDVYGYQEALEPIRTESFCSKLVGKNIVKKRIQETISVMSNYIPIKKVCYTEGFLVEEDYRVFDNEVVLQGICKMKSLCISEGREHGYVCVEKDIPYEIKVPVKGCTSRDRAVVTTTMDRADATVIKENELEMKGIIKAEVLVFSGTGNSILSRINKVETDAVILDEGPAMAVYIAGKNDTLWNVGKQYRVPIDELKENNHLTTDNLEAGQKILVVKSMK